MLNRIRTAFYTWLCQKYLHHDLYWVYGEQGVRIRFCEICSIVHDVEVQELPDRLKDQMIKPLDITSVKKRVRRGEL